MFINQYIMKIKNLPDKIFLNISSNEEEVDYNELEGVTFSTEPVDVTDCETENVCYVRQPTEDDYKESIKYVDNASKMQQELYTNGEVAYYQCDGRLVKQKIEDLINQPTQGLLYDLNRDQFTICTEFPTVKVMNELATINVLKYLHRVATDPDLCCGGCIHFKNEDAEGKGICEQTNKCCYCGYSCGNCIKKDN